MIIGLDAKYYADPAIFDEEQAKIFRHSWQVVGSAAALETPGAYRTIEIGDTALFVIRGEDGILRAFKNVCRHRGSRLLEGFQGSCGAIKCPYHAWRYDYHGQLRETPWFGEETPFDLDRWPLFEASVAVWRGIVFVSINPLAGLGDQLGDLPGMLEDTPLETMAELETLVFRAPVNWKAYLDQFTEYYHVPAAHNPDKAVGLEGYTALPFKQGMCMEAPQGLTYWASKWLWNWPNWTISTFPGGAKISRVMPLSAREIEVRFFFLFDNDAQTGQADRQRIIDATASIFGEDIAACSKAQPNYNSGAYQPGPLHPRHEQSTAYLHKLVRAALAT